MKKRIIFALAAAAVLISRKGFEKSFCYEDRTGIEHEICFTVNSDYISFEHYVAGDRTDNLFAGIVRHDVHGFSWKTWELEAYHDTDAAFIMLEIGPF